MHLETEGVVAQLVEQRTENPCVTGSIPVDATIKRGEYNSPFFIICVFWLLERLLKSSLSLIYTKIGVENSSSETVVLIKRGIPDSPDFPIVLFQELLYNLGYLPVTLK